ncbi:thermostable hemolysin [Thalassotalea fusca]
MNIRIITRDSELWEQSKELVKSAYMKRFEASIEVHYQQFFTCSRLLPSGEDNVIQACAGLKLASEGMLFSEQYLTKRVEQLVSESEKAPVDRDQIVEVGNLGSRSAGVGYELVRAIPFAAWCLGQRYVLLTATDKLRAMISKLGINYRSLGAASIENIPHEERELWGSYYASNPEVLYVPLRDNVHMFGNNQHFYSLALNHLSMNVRKGCA